MNRLDMLVDLKGVLCKCGNPKKAMRSFCGRCYYALPEGLRDRLYNRFMDGYEDAFAEALEHLVDIGRVNNE